MDKIWLVVGRSGEWDDEREWTVEAYLNEGSADEKVNLLNDTYQNSSLNSPNHNNNRKEEREAEERMRELDPNFMNRYSDDPDVRPKYFYHWIPFHRN